MAAVSYLQNIDTRPVEYKPYKLPWQGFMQEFSAKNQFFGESAAIIQQAYKNVLGLDPQFKQNKEYLKNFMDQAQKDLNRVVKSDMLVTDNAVNAANVFKPIFDTSKRENRLLLTDSELNKFYKSEGQKAELARTTKNGAGWNRNNQFYMESQYAKYREAAERGDDINSIEDHFSKKKGFIPYYDVLPELEKVKKLCHEDSNETTKVSADNYMLFDTRSATGVSQAKMQSCLGFLSDAAKQQIGINSYANYYNNKQGLVDDYRSYFVDGKKSEYDASLSMYAAASAYKGKDPKKLAEIQQLKALKDQKELEYKNGVTEWNSILNGRSERDYIEDNYDNIASVVGNVKFAERGSKALSWQEVESKLSANAAGIAMFKQQGDIYMQNLQFKQQQQLAEQKQGYEQSNIALKGDYDLAKEGLRINAKTGKLELINGVEPVDANLLPTPPESSKTEFDERMDGAFNNVSNSLNGLNKSVMNFIENTPSLTAEEKQQWRVRMASTAQNPELIANFIDVYDKMGINDPMINANIKAYKDAKQGFMDLKYTKKNIEKTVKRTPQQFNISMINGQKVNLTDAEVRQISQGQTVRGYNKAMFGSATLDYYDRAAKFNNDNYEERLEEAYRSQFTTSSRYFYTPETKPEEEMRTRNLRNRFGIPESYNISKFYTDKDGNAVFQLTEEIKDEDGNKTIRVLSKSEMEAMGLSGLKIENFGGPDEDGDTPKGTQQSFFRLDGYKAPMSSFIDPKLHNKLTIYTSAEMPDNVGEWADPGSDLEMTSSTGKNWKIRVGKVPDGNMQFRPIFKTFTEVNGKWVENPNPLNSIEQVVSVIENKKW